MGIVGKGGGSGAVEDQMAKILALFSDHINTNKDYGDLLFT